MKNSFSKEKRKQNRKKFRFREGISEYLKELEKKNSLTKQEKKHYTKKIKKAEAFLKNSKEDLNRLEKHQYHDNDDLEYKGIRQIENLFDEINEDYYKPIKTKGAFNNNYIEYESRGDKDKRLSVREYLYMIIPYLENMIRNYKAPIRDSNGVIIEDDLSGEWKIQLTMRINFVSSLDPGKKSYNGLKKW